MLVRARSRHKMETLLDFMKVHHYQEGNWTPVAHMKRPQKGRGRTVLCPRSSRSLQRQESVSPSPSAFSL